MKKVLFLAVLAVASVMAYAQPRAIGLRLGAFDGVSYQHSLGETNMIEIEAGWAVDGRTDFWEKIPGGTFHSRLWGQTVQLAATFDWIDPFGATFPGLDKGELHWYLGAGAAGGYGWAAYGRYDYHVYGGRADWGFVGACGRGGVEYDFWFPLQVSIDWRPTLGAGLYGYDDLDKKGVQAGFYWELTSLAISARYLF